LAGILDRNSPIGTSFLRKRLQHPPIASKTEKNFIGTFQINVNKLVLFSLEYIAASHILSDGAFLAKICSTCFEAEVHQLAHYRQIG